MSGSRAKAEGILGYPPPRHRAGANQPIQRYFIDTTDFGFNQGAFLFGEGVPVASGGGVPAVWALSGVGAWVRDGGF